MQKAEVAFICWCLLSCWAESSLYGLLAAQRLQSVRAADCWCELWLLQPAGADLGLHLGPAAAALLSSSSKSQTKMQEYSNYALIVQTYTLHLVHLLVHKRHGVNLPVTHE